MIDENFGARHHRLLFIEYQPGVSIAPHDHTFEEAYFILSGEVEATLDGKTYRARAGDVLWTGVGCVHTFVNTGTEPVRWLETFSPQPPKENVFRFMAEWETKARELEGNHDRGDDGAYAPVHRRRVSREPSRRPRDLDLRRARQGRHDASRRSAIRCG